MATTDLMAFVSANYDQMTKAEKKVADFVMAYPKKALNATITSLAKYCGVGETSVFRFCRTLNFEGYQQFRISLAISINDSGTLSAETININNSSSETEVAAKVLATYENAIKKTYTSLNYHAIDKAVRLLLSADFIYLFGAGGSGISAMEMHTKFSKIMANICFDVDLHQQLTKASLLKPKNAAVIFSNSGITKDAIKIAELCHDRRAHVIFITDFQQTPAEKYSDVILLSGGNEGPLEGGSITAKTSQMFMMDILYAEIYRRMGDHAVGNKKKTSEAIANKML